MEQQNTDVMLTTAVAAGDIQEAFDKRKDNEVAETFQAVDDDGANINGGVDGGADSAYESEAKDGGNINEMKTEDPTKHFEDPEPNPEIIEKLRGKPIYVRCQDKLPIGLRQLVYFLLFLLSIIIDFIIIIPLMILFTLFAYIYYIFSCQCLKYESKRFEPTRKTVSLCCCCCTSVTRRFFGRLRLSLISRKYESRDCCYRAFSGFIGIYQVFEYLLNQGKSGALNNGVSYTTHLWNCIGNDWINSNTKDIDNSYIPFLYGIATFNYEKVKEKIYSRDSIKSNNIFSMELCKTTQVWHPYNQIGLSTGTEKHRKSRELVFRALTVFSDLHKDKKELKNLAKYLKHTIIPSTKNINLSQIKRVTANALFYCITGGELNENEKTAIEAFISIGAGFNLIPSYIHFLLGGYMMERQLAGQYTVAVDAFLRKLNSKAINYIVKQANEYKMDLNIALRTVVMPFLIAGVAGTSGLASVVCDRIRRNPKRYIAMYKTNKLKFIKECARLETNPSAITVHLKEDANLEIGGKERFVPKGTPLICVMTAPHRDKKIFGQNAQSFDPNRENLDAILQWNSIEGGWNPNGSENDSIPLGVRSCPGHNLAQFIVELIVDNMVESFEYDYLKTGKYECDVQEPGCKRALGRLLHPFIEISKDEKHNTFYFTVVPEAVRTYFYIFFWALSGTGIAVTFFYKKFVTHTWKDYINSNPILNQFGDNNICIYFDDPPFTYFGAAFFCIVIVTIFVYFVFDVVRVYFTYKQKKFSKLTTKFVTWYAGMSIYEFLSVLYFVQIFATQPTRMCVRNKILWSCIFVFVGCFCFQFCFGLGFLVFLDDIENMYFHVFPFVNLQIAIWFLGFSHYLYFLKTDVISKGSKYYSLGIAYLIAMGITIIIKLSLDVPNLFKAYIFKQPGLGWTATLGQVNDGFFMLWVTVCPVFIYLLFVDKLDHIKVKFKLVSGFDREFIPRSKREEIRAINMEWDEVNKMSGGVLGYNYNINESGLEMERVQTTEVSQNSKVLSPSIGAISQSDGNMSDQDIDYDSDNNNNITKKDERSNTDLVRALEEVDGHTAKEKKELLEKYAFLKDTSTYKVFSPEEFADSNHEIIGLFEKNEKEKYTARIWRSTSAIIIPLLLFPFMAWAKATVIEMLGIALLLMFISYFIHIFSIFGRAARKPGNKIYRMYSVSAIAKGWTSMSVAYRVYAFPNHPIESISEFSAIDGGIAQTMLLTISCYSWAVVLCAIAFELEDKILGLTDDQSTREAFANALNIGDVCEVFGCFGLVLIGTFDLDPFNPTLQKLHYTGAALGVGTVVGYCYQQWVIGHYKDDIIAHAIFPIIISIIAFIAFCMWQFYGCVADRFPPQKASKKKKSCLMKIVDHCIPTEYNLERITTISLKNVISEAIFLFCGALCMCLWLFNYHECHQHEQCKL